MQEHANKKNKMQKTLSQHGMRRIMTDIQNMT